MDNDFPRIVAPTDSHFLPAWWQSASTLDRLADLALAEGRHTRAEHFSCKAAELRGEVRA